MQTTENAIGEIHKKISNMTPEEFAKHFSLKALSKEDILNRISVLSDEIDANEEENRLYQNQINDLYTKLDSM